MSMKKTAFFIPIILTLLWITSAMAVFAASDTGYKDLYPTATAVNHDDDDLYPDFYGRLRIPAAGIDVALYQDFTQEACDRKDSACTYPDNCETGTPFVADHNHQAFSNLKNVVAGDVAEVTTKTGSVISYVCVGVIDGHNTVSGIPYDIVDAEYAPVYGSADMITYTCKENWQNIRIVKWNKQKE